MDDRYPMVNDSRHVELPTLGGTPSLIHDYGTAIGSLRNVRLLIGRLMPRDRDFVGRDVSRAMQQHRQRLTLLLRVERELLAMAESLHREAAKNIVVRDKQNSR